MGESLSCNTAFFSIRPESKEIKTHLENGGIAAVIEDEYITIYEGNIKTRVEKTVNIPLTSSDQSLSTMQALLPAVLCGFLSHFKIKDIRQALRTFIPDQPASIVEEATELAENFHPEA